jgi:serine/threonine protein kinase
MPISTLAPIVDDTVRPHRAPKSMADRTILDEWLDHWEQALEVPGSADLDAFVERNCQDADPMLITEFRSLASAARFMKSLAGSDVRSTLQPGIRPALQPGVEVIPGYCLDRWRGGGGFGEVWQARSPLGTAVALKFVSLARDRVQKEFRGLKVMTQSRHPHLLSVFGSWQTDEFLVIEMELADRTLHERLHEAEGDGLIGIPRDELLGYFEQAADALDYLNSPHRGADGQELPGIQHRDIKPQNLLLVGSTLKVGDFSLARWLEKSASTHTGGCTPAYAPPELFAGKVTRWSDQYSLAVTWCQLRGGRLPFGDPARDHRNDHFNRPPDVSMLQRKEQYPVRRALSKQPRQRWPSCLAFVAALRESVIAKRQTVAPPPPIPAGLVKAVELNHRSCVTALAFSKCGTLLTSASEDCSVRVGNTKTGEQVAVQPRGDFRWAFVSVAISPDASTIASVSRGRKKASADLMEPYLWQPKSRTRKQPGYKERYSYPFLSPAFSPVGRLIAFACDRIRLFDIDSGEQRQQFPEERNYPRCVCFSPDGAHVITGHDDGSIHVWEISGCHRRAFSGHRAQITALAVSPNGNLLASADEKGNVQLRRFPTGRQRQAISNLYPVMYLAFLPDSLHLISFHEREEGGLVRLWHFENGQRGRDWSPSSSRLNCVALAPDGVLLAAGEASGKVRLWNLRTVIDDPNLPPHQESES